MTRVYPRVYIDAGSGNDQRFVLDTTTLAASAQTADVSVLQVNVAGSDVTTAMTDNSVSTWQTVGATGTWPVELYFDGLPTSDEGTVTATVRVLARGEGMVTTDRHNATHTALETGNSFGPLTADWQYHHFDVPLYWDAGDGYYSDFLHMTVRGWDIADVSVWVKGSVTDPEWVAVPDEDVRGVSVRRGGARFRYDAGTASVVLDNRGGSYDPMNAAGPYVGPAGSLIRPGALARVDLVTATDAGVETAIGTVFTGRMEDVELSTDGVVALAVWTFSDELAWLGFTSNLAAGGAEASCGDIATDLLEEAGLPVTGVAAAGRTVVRPDGGGSLRDALDRIANSEAGRFYVDKSGVVRLEWRASEATKVEGLGLGIGGAYPTPLRRVTYSGTFSDVVNRVTVRRDGFDDVTASNAASVAAYREQSLSIDAALASDGDAADLAQFLADFWSQPGRNVETAEAVLDGWTADTMQWFHAYGGFELGTLLPVTITDAGYFRGTVESLAFDFGTAGAVCRWGFAPYDPAGYGNASWFVLDTATLNGSSLLSAY